MSWDVYLMKVPENINSMEQLDDEFDPQPLGDRDEILCTMKELYPTADFSDTEWIILDTNDYSMEFAVSGNDPVDSITVFIHGNENCIDVVEKICDRMGWKAVDTGTGDFMDFSDNKEGGFREWNNYKNQVLGEVPIRKVKNEEVNKKKRWWKFWGEHSI